MGKTKHIDETRMRGGLERRKTTGTSYYIIRPLGSGEIYGDYSYYATVSHTQKYGGFIALLHDLHERWLFGGFSELVCVARMC